jgi:transporter family protein
MTWIIWAIIPPLIWSLLNHLDKYLISKYSHHVGVGGLVIMSSLFAGLTLPVIYLINASVIDILVYDSIILTLSGLLVALGILFYLYALDTDETSIVVLFWLLIPIFSYFLGILFLGEYIQTTKIIGSVVVLIGVMVLSIDIDQKYKIKIITPILMIMSSLAISVSNMMFKSLNTEYSFWQGMFWNQGGLLLFALLSLIFVKRYRHDFVSILRINNLELGLFNAIGEALQIVAAFIAYYSILMAPVSLVLLIGYTAQPMFVFLSGIILSLLFPKVVKEKVGHKHLFQRTLAIIIMLSGVYQIVL